MAFALALGGCAGPGAHGGEDDPPGGFLEIDTVEHGLWEEVASWDGRLYSVHGTGPADVFVVGEQGSVLHFDGEGWQRIDTGATRDLHGVWCGAGGEVFVVGGESFRFDGQRWRAMTLPFDLGGRDVWGSDSAHVIAIGSKFGEMSNAGLARFDGARWSETTPWYLPSPGAVWGSGAGEVYVVGSYSMILRTDDDGASWSRVEHPSHGDLFGVGGSAADDVFAVGAQYGADRNDGSLAHYDGVAWERVQLAERVPVLRGVWAGAADDVIVVGHESFAMRRVGETWAKIPVSGATVDLVDVWGAGADVYAVGTVREATPPRGVVLRYRR